jgi:hypothetical protein
MTEEVDRPVKRILQDIFFTTGLGLFFYVYRVDFFISRDYVRTKTFPKNHFPEQISCIRKDELQITILDNRKNIIQ